MSWRYAYIILDSPFYKRSGLLHPSSQQSVTTCSTLKFYFQSSIFNSNKEFTSDTWIVEHCKEFIAQFIYLSFCGQISPCDHFSHILDCLSVYSDQMHHCQTPFLVMRFALREFSYNLALYTFSISAFLNIKVFLRTSALYVLIYQWRKISIKC